MDRPVNVPTSDNTVLLLRLGGPLQSWGSHSEFNRRETAPEPTKSAVLGLVAAADGRQRGQSLADLISLRMGVRVDQPGRLLDDFHTVSDYRNRPLLQVGVSTKGIQKLTSPAKPTHVTHRYYLQDAVFVAALAGPTGLMQALEEAIRHPAYPLALGRRSCPPTQPISLGLHQGELVDVLTSTPWQATETKRRAYGQRHRYPPQIYCSATIEDPAGDDVNIDVPSSFQFGEHNFTSRRVQRSQLPIPTGFQRTAGTGHDPSFLPAGHDPFTLLG